MGKEYDAGFLAVFGVGMLVPAVITGMIATLGDLPMAVPIGFFTLSAVLAGPMLILWAKAILRIYIEVIKD